MIEVQRDSRIIRIADRHAIYRNDLSKHFDSYFSVIRPVQQGDCLVADFSARRLHTLVNGSKFEFTSIPEEAIDYFRYWGGGGIAFDLGAYCGLTTYEVAQRADTVIAVEPDPENMDCLRSNMERLQISNVVLVPSAVTGRCGRDRFSVEGAIGSAFQRLNGRPSAGSYCEVETATLSKLADTFGVPSFIKADIEGAEVEVLAEAIPLLKQHHPVIALDTNHWHGSSFGTYRQCEAILSECGYCVESLQIGGMWTTFGWI